MVPGGDRADVHLFPVEMESDRLRYERVHPAGTDVFELYEAANETAPDIEETTRYLTWEPHRHPKETLEFVEHAGEQFDEGTGAHYVVRPREEEDDAGQFAGTTGLTVDWERRLGNLGIWLRPPFWGRGYSGERAARLLDLAFGRLDLAVVAVTHDPANERSRGAIEKYVERFGGRREGRLRNDLVVDGEARDSVRHSISRAEWAASDGPGDATSVR